MHRFWKLEAKIKFHKYNLIFTYTINKVIITVSYFDIYEWKMMSTPNLKFRKIQKHSSVSQKPTSCDKIKLYSRLDKQIKKSK